MARTTTPASKLTKEVVQAFGLFGIALHRRNVGMFRDHTGRPVRFGRPGQSDLHGAVPPTGRAIEVEIKANKDALTDHQWLWLDLMRRAGAVVVVVRSVQDALDIANRLRADPNAVFDLPERPKPKMPRAKRKARVK